MASALKHFFDERVLRLIAAELEAAMSLDTQKFVADCRLGLDALELTERGWHIAGVMHGHLPQPFARAGRVLLDSVLRAPSASSPRAAGSALPDSFRYLPHVFYVQQHGLAEFDLSMQLQYELTRRFTAESSIRAFLVKHPEATLARLRRWATDPSPDVRRLVSEGTRPRLPWAPRLRAYERDPRPVLELLELLRDDDERYVQRSVANNLNDISKDHPNLAVDVCRRWLVAAPPGRAWIVRHALRSLIKRGDPGALSLLGAGGKPRIALTAVRITPRVVHLGESVRFSCELASRAKRPQDLLIDYAVHFVKASGVARPKVFKLKRLVLSPEVRVELSKKISLVDRTTRRHYAGRHAIDLIINGVKYPLGTFRLRR